MKWLTCLLVLAGTNLCGCDRERASVEQCRAIFDRLVALELAEMGFDDPALAVRRQEELAARYREELATCVGRPLEKGALDCVRAAHDTEELSHVCLR